MNVLFLTLCDFNTFNESGIYCDVLREFVRNGHGVYCISPTERKNGIETHFEDNGHILKLKIGNTQKTNIVEKGISTLLIEPMFIGAIKKYFGNIKFDLVLYSTPPVTLAKVIEYVKKRDNAKTYLMLKDIFPQNAVDLGMMSANGYKGLLYKYFRHKEKKLYALSDRIGCMSLANVNYVLKHNPEISPDIVEICPNSIEPVDMSLSESDAKEMRVKYGIPLDKEVFVYGGNLGRPQDVPFIVECIKACSELKDVFFVVAGSGTDRHILEEYIEKDVPSNVKLFDHLPKAEYDSMIACCDCGLIFLDHRFTIPNFPSRLLSYMQAGLPVMACVDANTDVGKTIVDGGFGWWCESNDTSAFVDMIKAFDLKNIGEYKKNSAEYLKNNYTSRHSYDVIVRSISQISQQTVDGER